MTLSDDSASHIEQFQQYCKRIGIDAMNRVQTLSLGDETEFQYGLLLVIQQLHEHLGLSISARKVREEFMKELESTQITEGSTKCRG